MYRILIHKPTMPKGQFAFYTITDIDTDTSVDPPVVTKNTYIWESDDMTELQDTYIELLDTYTKEQIRPVDDLAVELSVEITDETT